MEFNATNYRTRPGKKFFKEKGILSLPKQKVEYLHEKLYIKLQCFTRKKKKVESFGLGLDLKSHQVREPFSNGISSTKFCHLHHLQQIFSQKKVIYTLNNFNTLIVIFFFVH